MDKLDSVIQKVLRFRNEREWVQFHTPKNLATALSIEAGELQELMLWKTDKEVTTMIASVDGKQRCIDEIADVLIFALLFCACSRVGFAQLPDATDTARARGLATRSE
jgi:NTP pyrophosphatase (non-canonical NTP hydrolase)